MKVAALSPHFTIEAPPGVEKTEAERTAADLRLRVVKPEAPSPSDNGTALDQETRAALQRLSALIREKHQEKKPGAKNSKAAADDIRDRNRRRAFLRYRDVFEARDPDSERGENFDEYF